MELFLCGGSQTGELLQQLTLPGRAKVCHTCAGVTAPPADTSQVLKVRKKPPERGHGVVVNFEEVMNINEVTPTFLLNQINIHTASVFIRQANRVGSLETLRNKYSQVKRLISQQQ